MKDIYVSVVNCEDEIHNIHVHVYIYIMLTLNQMLQKNMVHIYYDS